MEKSTLKILGLSIVALSCLSVGAIGGFFIIPFIIGLNITYAGFDR